MVGQSCSRRNSVDSRRLDNQRSKLSIPPDQTPASIQPPSIAQSSLQPVHSPPNPASQIIPPIHFPFPFIKIQTGAPSIRRERIGRVNAQTWRRGREVISRFVSGGSGVWSGVEVRGLPSKGCICFIPYWIGRGAWWWLRRGYGGRAAVQHCTRGRPVVYDCL
jgi:hypothetical protein